MKWLLSTVVVSIAVSGCSANMVIVKRDSSLTGKGTVEAVGKRLTASIGEKKCNGNFANVRDFSSVGLINAHAHQTTGLNGATVTGSITTGSTTGVAKGVLTCNDGDVWHCEIRHDGPSGYGVCIGNNKTVYDVITGVFRD